MYVVYICAYIVLVCIGIYIHAYESFYAVATFCRGALLFLATFATFAAVFIIAAVSITFAASCVGFWLFAPPCLYRRPRVPFAVPFALKRLQRSFYSVFRAVLSGLIVWRVHLHSLHHLSRLYSLICGKIAVFRGV